MQNRGGHRIGDCPMHSGQGAPFDHGFGFGLGRMRQGTPNPLIYRSVRLTKSRLKKLRRDLVYSLLRSQGNDHYAGFYVVSQVTDDSSMKQVGNT